MNTRLLSLILGMLLAVPPLCVAIPNGNAPQIWVVDRLVAGAAYEQLRPLAVKTLVKIALGIPDSVSAEAVKAFGIPTEPLEGPWLRQPEVRAHAIIALADSGLPEAEVQLAALSPEALGPDPSGMLYPTVARARQMAHLKQISDPQAQTAYLEQLVSKESAVWAEDALCNQGSAQSLPMIEDARAKYPLRADDDFMQFCRERVVVISGNADRAKALGSVLLVGDVPGDQRLMTWALGQLEKMNSPEADAEMTRFRAEVSKLPAPEDDPSRQQAWSLGDAVRRWQARKKSLAAPFPLAVQDK